MKKWITSLIVSAVITSFLFIPSGFLFADSNLVKNGDFNNDLRSWSSYEAELDEVNGKPAPSVKLGPTELSNIFQSIDNSNKNLLFSFDIRPALAVGELRVNIFLLETEELYDVVDIFFNFSGHEPALPVGEWSSQSIRLSDMVWEDQNGVSKEFNVLRDFDKMEIVFYVVGGSEVNLDNISLVPLAKPKPAAPAPAPIDSMAASSYEPSAEGFVTMLYNRILKRGPDGDGLSFWTEGLQEGTSSGPDTVYGFIFSPEAQEELSGYSNEEFITFLYKALFNRTPDPEGLERWLAQMDGMTLRQVLEGFTQSEEFANILKNFGL